MADEDKKIDVDVVEPDKEGKHPESVSWEQYVRTKETIGNKLSKETEKVKSLEETLKSTISAEEYKKVSDELETTKAKLKETSDTMTQWQEQSLSKKRAALVNKGLSAEQVKDMSEKELNAVALALGTIKPKADMSGGGGGDTPKTPRARIQSGFEMLHPQK